MAARSQLDEILDRVKALPEPKRKQLARDVAKATAAMVWVPNPGPQHAAFRCLADELYYGGQAGGGKSDVSIGLALTEHENSLVLRRYNDDAKVLAERTMDIVGSRDGYNGTELRLRPPRLTGKQIDFGGCKDLVDRERYKGDPHDLICVGRGTLVLMADLSYRRVETLLQGDSVQTLEGPRRVIRVHPIQRKPAVEVVARDAAGRELARQIQSTTHPLLCDAGWISAADLDAAYAPTQSHDDGMPPRSLSERCASPKSNPEGSIYRWLRKAESALRLLGRRYGVVTIAADRQSAWGNDYAGSVCGREDDLPPRLSCGPVAPSAPWARSAARGRALHSAVRVNCDAPTSSRPRDSQWRCSVDFHPCDARSGPVSDPLISATAARVCLLRSDDAEQPSPSHSLSGVPAETRTRSHPPRTYVHPYTGEIRSIDVSGSLLYSALEVVSVGEMEVFDLQIEEVNHYITSGGFINQNCFDEIPDFLEAQYTFIIGWNRSTNPNQRCRVVCTGNPPTTPEGLWVLRRWGAWLDPNYAKPAADGELRWYTTINGKDTEVDGPGPHMIANDVTGVLEPIIAKSRTFIRAKLADNPDLAATNYDAVLASMPEELRAAYRDGRFDAGLKDSPRQMIPSAWIREAIDRWTEKPPIGVPMCAIAADCTGGGKDPLCIGWRHDYWFSKFEQEEGRNIPQAKIGRFTAGAIVQHRRDRATIIIDLGGGYGNAAYEHLINNDDTAASSPVPTVVGHKGGEGTTQRTRPDQQLGFKNKRTLSLWRLREALDPNQVGGSSVALPNDPEMVSDLAAVTFEVIGSTIVAEPKEDVCARLGRSTNKGDVVCMLLTAGATASTDGAIWEQTQKQQMRHPLGRRPQVIKSTRTRR